MVLNLTVNISDNDRIADIFRDGYINLIDLMLLAQQWLEQCLPDEWCQGADLTGVIGWTSNPGSVDLDDFGILSYHWHEAPLVISEFI